MDALRIAEIRAFARAESPSGRDGVVLGHRELIALCDLAERGLDVAQAIERYDPDVSPSGIYDRMARHRFGEWMRYDAELVRDAMRYRWLKRAMGDGNTPDSETAYTTVTCLPSEKWDAAIDTAIAQADGGEG